MLEYLNLSRVGLSIFSAEMEERDATKDPRLIQTVDVAVHGQQAHRDTPVDFDSIVSTESRLMSTRHS